SRRPDLPAAADPVLAKALAKAPGDRYETCLEFASALRRACGLGTDTGGPVAPPHDQWSPTVTVPAVPPPGPPRAPPPRPPPPDPAPSPEPAPAPVPVGMPVPASTPATPDAPGAPDAPPDRRRPAPGSPGYRLPHTKAPRSQRSRMAVLVACIVLLAVI